MQFARGRLFSAVRGKPMPEWAVEFDAPTWAPGAPACPMRRCARRWSDSSSRWLTLGEREK